MMRRTLVLLMFCASAAFAGGPKWAYPESPKLDDEIRNIYHDIANPAINQTTAQKVTASSATITVMSVSSATINHLTVGSLSGVSLGKVLQVVSGTTSTGASQAAPGYTDSNLTATIVLASTSSKVGVFVSQYVTINVAAAGTSICKLKLLRASTTVVDTPVLTQSGATPTLTESMVPLVAYDSPATSGSVVYKTQIGTNGASGSCIANNNPGGNSTSTILLVEFSS
jgi:hypothetical protein